ncbi:Protein MAIN-LIKE 1 [Glycine soja]
MVRTRGLGCALGQVTGRGIGRGDRDDSDDAPQLAVIADHVNEPVIPMPDVQDDPMEAPTAVEDIPADTRAEPAEDAHEGFLGGTSDPSVLTQYADHVACSVWTGEERPELKLSSHGRKVHSLGRLVPAIEGLIADTGDRGLLSAFVERWHRETFSFHLLVGELTITLDDVSFLLHLPVIGDLHAFEPLHGDDAVQMLVDLLMVSPESARTETVQCRGPYIRLQWVRDIYQRRCQAGHWTAAACAYLHHLLGCTLFANKSATNVHVVYLEALRDLSMTEMYAWGVAALVHMYDQLNDASCWIYEHFPSVAESTADQDYDEASPLACRWIATKKTVKSIRTPSYRERLDRLRIPDVYDDDDDYLVSNSYVEESLDEDDSVDGISDTDDEVTNIPQPVRIVHPAEGAQRIENPFWNHALHYNNINWSYPDEEDICGLEMSSTFNIGQELYVGMEFDSKDAVKNAVKQYVMKVHQSFKVVESKSNKYVAFKYCKPIIQVDGTHLYGKYRGTLLMATSQDGNGGVLPLAFVVVEGETLTVWSWFLAHLREHVTDKNGICLISDRHASIKSAVTNEALRWQPPHDYHVYCVRHIASNFNRKFNNAKQKEMLKKLATWIDRISKEKWTMTYDREGHRYGHMTTNLSECINKVLKDCRNIPITALVKSTYSRCRKYFVERGRQAQRQLNEGQVYCSKLVKELRKNLEQACSHIVRVYDIQSTRFEVEETFNPITQRGGQKWAVNLNGHYCQCGRYYALHYPCSHIIAACGYVSMNYYQYIDVVYINEHILKAYSAQWWPLGNEAAIPPSSDAWTLIPDLTTIRAKGRPKSTRIMNKMDWDKPSEHRQKCSRCGADGHNRRRCPMQSEHGSCSNH